MNKSLSLHKLLATLLTMAALFTGQQAFAHTDPMSLTGHRVLVNDHYRYTWQIAGFLGAPQSRAGDGSSYTFNNENINLPNNCGVTINGTLNFAIANDYTDVTTGSEVTITFHALGFWFREATVKNLSGTIIQGCSYSTSSDYNSITITIPQSKTFGNIYLDYSTVPAMTENNTTISGIDETYIYVGSAIAPQPTVVYTNPNNTQTNLHLGTDYTLSYANNNGPGTATVTITGTGDYVGSISIDYTIRNLDLIDFNSLGNDTYEIANKDDLDRLALLVDLAANNCQGITFKQTADITYTYSGIDTENNFTTIGGYFVVNGSGDNKNFSGTYDGDNHTISGIRVYKDPSSGGAGGYGNYYVGLFGRITSNTTIKNVILTDTRITGYRFVGGLVGSNVGGTIQSCLVIGSSINCGTTYVGALVGTNNNNPTLTANHYRNCNVTLGSTTNNTNVGVGNGNTSNDVDGARSIHTLTLGQNITATGESVTYNSTTYYASNTPITLGYNNLPDGYEVAYSLNGTALNDNTFTMPANDEGTVSATLTPITYNITYELDGGSVAIANPTSYTIETPTFTLNNPTKPGYTFVGWTGSNGNTPQTTVTITQGTTGDLSYTANWIPTTYTITYDLDGGSVATANPTTYNIETPAFTLNNPTRPYYTFAGWTGTGLTEPTQTVTIAQGSYGDRNYIANWTPSTFNITYNLDGGSVATANPTTYNIETPTFTLNNPTKESYTFTGWTGSNGTTPQTTVTIIQGTTGNLNYTANWTPITYNITYDLDGGSVATASPTTYTIETPTFTLNNPTKLACNFDGWTGSNGDTPETTVTIAQGSYGDRNYTANWTQYAFTLTLGTDITATGDVAVSYNNINYYAVGTEITLAYNGTIPEGQHLVFEVNGTPIPNNGNTFAMPAANVNVSVSFHDWTGSGTQGDPYLISTTTELNLLAKKVNGTDGFSANNFSGTYFLQAANLTYDGTENNYTPIGDNDHNFKGHYNGGGYAISGINVNTTGDYVGLFGYVTNQGSVENVTLANSTIRGNAQVGGIVGALQNNGTLLSNCCVGSDVTIGARNSYAYNHGGIVGICNNATIEGCTSAATITYNDISSSEHYGGIVGFCQGNSTVKDCLYTGSSIDASNSIGAITGDCGNNGVVTLTNNYYTNANIDFGGVNGSDVNGARRGYTITLQNENIAFIGTQTTYNASGLTAIGESVLCYDNGTTTTYYSGESQTVTLNCTPPAGYVFKGFTVTKDGTDPPETVTVTENNGVYSFSMPAANVTVSATVAEITGNQYQLYSGELVEGDYLIVYDGLAMNKAIYQDSFRYEEVTAINDLITTDNTDIVWHIAPSPYGGYWTIGAGNGLYAASTGSTGKVQLLYNGSDEKALWRVETNAKSESSVYDFKNKYNHYNNVGAYLRNYKINTFNYGFACYSQSFGGALSLYKRVEYTPVETYTLEITGYTSQTTGWHLIASPVYTTPSEVENMLTDETEAPYSFDLYRFNQSATAEWENYHQHSNDFDIIPGQGYLYANSGTVTLTFVGAPYNDYGDFYLTYSEYNDDQNMWGWNLVGNPWDAEAEVFNKEFYRMNEEGSEIIPAESSVVHPMEGIFVHAEDNGDIVTFNRCSKAKGGNGNNASLVVNLFGGNRGSVIDRAIVRFDSESTLPKLQIFEDSPKLYIPQDGEEYAIVSMGNMGEIPVNFKATKNGEYTITVNPEGVEMGYLHLIDNMTGADVDLLASPEYTFTAKTSDYESRFRLVFSVCGDANGDNEAPFAFINNGNIIVNGEGTLQVVDVMGRILVSGDAINRVSTGGMAAGVYVLRLINGEDVRTQRIVVR